MATSLINVECKRFGCMKNLLACYANCRYNTRCDELRGEVLANQEQATADINAYRATRGTPPIQIQPLKRGLKFVDLSASRKERQAVKQRQVKKPTAAPRTGEVRGNRPNETIEKLSPKVARKAQAEKPHPPARPKSVAPPTTDKTTPKKQKRAKAQAVTEIVPATVKAKIIKPKTGRVMARRAKEKSAEGRAPNEAFATATVEASKFNRDASPEIVQTASRTISKLTRKPASAKGESRRRRSARKQSSAPRKQGKKTFIILNGDRASVVDEQGLIAQLLTGSTNGSRFFEVQEVEARLELVYKR